MSLEICYVIQRVKDNKYYTGDRQLSPHWKDARLFRSKEIAAKESEALSYENRLRRITITDYYVNSHL